MIEGGSKLAAALVAAQRSAKSVEKGSLNSFHRYKYASAEDVILEARADLSAAGLSLSIQSGMVMQTADFPVPVLTVVYRLEHESGEARQITTQTPVIEEKGRPWDKAVATARTYSVGYVLRDILLLPRVEEGTDVDQRDDRNLGSGARRSTKEGKAEAKAEPPKRDPIDSYAEIVLHWELKMSTVDMKDAAAREAMAKEIGALSGEARKRIVPKWAALVKEHPLPPPHQYDPSGTAA